MSAERCAKCFDAGWVWSPNPEAATRRDCSAPIDAAAQNASEVLDQLWAMSHAIVNGTVEYRPHEWRKGYAEGLRQVRALAIEGWETARSLAPRGGMTEYHATAVLAGLRGEALDVSADDCDEVLPPRTVPWHRATMPPMTNAQIATSLETLASLVRAGTVVDFTARLVRGEYTVTAHDAAGATVSVDPSGGPPDPGVTSTPRG